MVTRDDCISIYRALRNDKKIAFDTTAPNPLGSVLSLSFLLQNPWSSPGLRLKLASLRGNRHSKQGVSTKSVNTLYECLWYLPRFDAFAALGPRTGDVRSFNALMTKWERVFITKGTYLLMEKCLMLVYRNLVKKM